MIAPLIAFPSTNTPFAITIAKEKYPYCSRAIVFESISLSICVTTTQIILPKAIAKENL